LPLRLAVTVTVARRRTVWHWSMRRTRSPAASDLAGQPARLRLTAGWAPSHWQCGQPRLPGSDSDSEPEPGARARPPTGRLPGRSAAAGGLCCLCIMMPGASGPSDSRTRTAVATVAVTGCQSPSQSYSAGPSRRRRPGNRDQARGCNGESPGPVGPMGPPGRAH